MSSWEIFHSHTGRRSIKWVNYFPIFDRHFSSWKNRTLTFLEIGVLDGGSGEIWSKFFGPMAQIVGIDINPECKKYQSRQYQIRIGDQSDTNFLQSVIDEFGVPDIVLDDGSHMQNHVLETFRYLYPKMHLNSIYMIEDLHTSYDTYFNGGLANPNSFINQYKNYLDQLHAEFNMLMPDPVLKDTFSMTMYNSVAVFEKGRVYKSDFVYSGNITANDK